MNVAIIQAVRPQLRAIYQVMTSVALQLTEEEELGPSYRRPALGEIVLSQARGDIKINDHISGVCRVTRREKFSYLYAAKVIRAMDDVDVMKCGEQSDNPLGKLKIIMFI